MDWIVSGGVSDVCSMRREKMNDLCTLNRSSLWIMLVLVGSLQLNFIFCWSLNDEGISLLDDPSGALLSWNEDNEENDPCSCFGIECVDGHVVSRLLDNNGLYCHVSPKLKELMISEVQVDENHLTSAAEIRYGSWGKTARMLDESTTIETPRVGQSESHQDTSPSLPPPPSFNTLIKQPTPPPHHEVNIPEPKTEASKPPPQQPPQMAPSTPGVPSPPPPPLSLLPRTSAAKAKSKTTVIVLGVVGGFIGLVLVMVVGMYLWRSNGITKVQRRAIGLSGKLQNAFVTGIPNLKRSELETACEDFSNVIGFSSIGTMYKGTLSNGLEIAVISLALTSAKDWSKNLETQFRKKIETLTKVNHKNFVNLIGYCEEEKPFTRMMVFEYAPNGSLFEHLHIREAEHLDWGLRLKVAMGIAYCLEHMHQLVPPITLPNLDSSAVSLSEDYAAKISDFCLWNEGAGAQAHPTDMGRLSPSSASPESNVYCFGSVLLEMMTGEIPHSLEKSSLKDWVFEYLRGDKTLEELVDPMLRHFNPKQLESISELIRKCLHPDPIERPTMKDVSARFREITGINSDKAMPRTSTLWWAELETRSANSG